MAAKQAMKETLQCTSKYGHLRISQDICHVRMTDIEGFLTIYGHSDNLLNNNIRYPARPRRIIVKYTNNTDIADQFNGHFINVGPLLASKIANSK